MRFSKARAVSAMVSSLLVALAGAGVAAAEVVTASDPQPKCSQRPALDVRRATFNYSAERFAWHVKMGELSKKRTRVIGRYTTGTRRDPRIDVMVMTWFDAQQRLRVRATWSDLQAEDYDNPISDVAASWDFRRDVVHLSTDHVVGVRADAWAYSVAKGAMHGPYCGDYISSGRIARG